MCYTCIPHLPLLHKIHNSQPTRAATRTTNKSNSKVSPTHFYAYPCGSSTKGIPTPLVIINPTSTEALSTGSYYSYHSFFSSSPSSTPPALQPSPTSISMFVTTSIQLLFSFSRPGRLNGAPYVTNPVASHTCFSISFWVASNCSDRCCHRTFSAFKALRSFCARSMRSEVASMRCSISERSS